MSKVNAEYATLIESIKEKHENTAQLISEMAKQRLDQAREKEAFETASQKQDIYISELKSQIAALEKEDSSKMKEIEHLREVEKTLIEEFDLTVKFPILPPEDPDVEAENTRLSTELNSMKALYAESEGKIEERKNLSDTYLVHFESY